MCEFLEICKLAQNTLLPAFELVEDHTPLHYDQSQAKVISNSISLIRSRFETCQFTPEMRENSEVIPLVLLCGENSCKAEWNTELAVEEAAVILRIICQKWGVDNVEELMNSKRVCKLIEEIRPKLGKACFKKHPAAIHCFLWILRNTKHPHIDDVVNLALPISLILIDDYESDNQRKGLQAVHHILTEASTSILQHLGWASVIHDALKPSHYRDLVEILEVFTCLNLCLNVLCLNPTNPSYWSKIDSFDDTLNQLLWHMEMEQSDEARCQYLKILMDYISCMKIRSFRFFPALCKLFETYITTDCSVELCIKSLEVLDHLLRHCWPCKGLDYMQDVMWIVFKAHHRGETSSNSGDHVEIRKSVERCIQTIEQISPGDVTTLHTMMETAR